MLSHSRERNRLHFEVLSSSNVRITTTFVTVIEGGNSCAAGWVRGVSYNYQPEHDPFKSGSNRLNLIH